jgi:subtilisin family serine protease
MSNTHVVVVSFLLGLLAPGTWAADTAGPPAPEPLIIHGQPGLGAPTTSDLPDVADLGAYAPDRILVKFRRRTSPTAGTPVGGHKVLRHPAAQGRRMRSELTPGQSAILSAIGGRISRGFQRTGWLVVDVDVSVGNAIERLYASGEVLYAEPDYVGRARDIPNDTFFDEQWALNNTGQDIGDDPGGTNDADIDAPEGWDDRDHARSVIAVIIDSGVDYEHEDLADNMWRNPDEQPGNGIDDDGNGYIDDIFGVNTIAGAPTTDPMDDNQHGTHVAGIVGAVGDNGTGITGVAREVRLVAVKWLGADNTGFASDVIAALGSARGRMTTRG